MVLSKWIFRTALLVSVSSLVVSVTMVMKPLPVAKADDGSGGGPGWEYCVGPSSLPNPGARSGGMSGCSVTFRGTGGLSYPGACRGEYDYSCPEGTYICVYNFGASSSMCDPGVVPDEGAQ
jgi:hypothetical protein